jgi:hypothetical protein
VYSPSRWGAIGHATFARAGTRQIGNALVLVVLALVAGPSSPVQAVPANVLGVYTGYGNAAADQAIGAELGHPLAFGSDYIPYTHGWTGMVDPPRRVTLGSFRIADGLWPADVPGLVRYFASGLLECGRRG